MHFNWRFLPHFSYVVSLLPFPVLSLTNRFSRDVRAVKRGTAFDRWALFRALPFRVLRRRRDGEKGVAFGTVPIEPTELSRLRPVCSPPPVRLVSVERTGLVFGTTDGWLRDGAGFW